MYKNETASLRRDVWELWDALNPRVEADDQLIQGLVDLELALERLELSIRVDPAASSHSDTLTELTQTARTLKARLFGTDAEDRAYD